MAQRLKRLPAMQETWVWPLGGEDPLEREMATHSSILAWRIPWKEEPGGLQSMGLQRVGHDWATSLSLKREIKQKVSFLLIQDDGVDDTKATTSCWTTIERRMPDIPHPKTKKKPQWDGRMGTITIKSNPISNGWVTHKLENNNTKELLPLLWRFRFPWLGRTQ